MARKLDPWVRGPCLVLGIVLLFVGAFLAYVGEGIHSAATYPTEFAFQLALIAGLPLVAGLLLIWAGLRTPGK